MRIWLLLCLGLATAVAPAVEIRIDYTYDTSNFFSTPERRAAIEAVARFFSELLEDELLEIDPADFTQASWIATFTHPATGARELIENPVIPANTIIVYVGARDLSFNTTGVAGPGGFSASGFPDFFERIVGRGSTAAAIDPASLRTDFAPWGGSIAFDSVIDGSPRLWNFSRDANAPGNEFISVALHEMAHVLGVGTADSWDNQVDNEIFVFRGANVVRSNRGTAPELQVRQVIYEDEPGVIVTEAGGHYADLNSTQYGSFGAPHGASRPALMNPTSTDTGTNFDVATDLDLAALVDIGWELSPNPRFAIMPSVGTSVMLQWNSVSFFEYTLTRSDDLLSLRQPQGGSQAQEGSGTGHVQTFTEPNTDSGRVFFELTQNPVGTSTSASSPASASLAAPAGKHSPGKQATLEKAPRVIQCSVCDNEH